MDEEDTSRTRVFVTGLPPTLTSEDLGKHFAARYQITDAHVLPGRRIGFVGFRNYTLAKNAIKYFNKSYIRMSKIQVDFAKPVELEHPTGQQARPITKRNHPQMTLGLGGPDSSESLSSKTGLQPYTLTRKTDSSLKRKRADESSDKETKLQTKSETRKIDEGSAVAAQSDDAQKKLSKEERRALKKAKKAAKEERKREQTGSADMKAGEDRASVLDISTEPAADGDQPNAPVTDDDAWLRSKTNRTLDLADDDEASPVDQQSATAIQAPHPLNNKSISDFDSEAESETSSNENGVNKLVDTRPSDSDFPSTNRLFIRNLSYSTEESDLKELFSTKFSGKVIEVHIVRDTRKNTNKGFAYVSFTDEETAKGAALEFDGKTVQGRILHVLPATERQSKKLDDYELSKLPLKTQRLIKRKEEAGKQTLSWNSLYMNPDAVISSIADRLGVSKSAILDPTSSDAAAKQAQAETHVIQETKAYFTKFGVDFDAFQDKPRGGKALLAKNLAYGTTSDDLKALFNVCGEVTRILLPPSGVIAIAEFAEADQAQRAIKQLAYRNVKGSPLYLEKAPKDLFSSSSGKVAGVEKDSDETNDTEDMAAVSSGTSSTLFVRNLNFSTTSARLADTFRPLQGFLTAKVQTRTDSKRPGEILSMGYGFVEFRTRETAQIALKTMNGYRLDDHELLVRFSQQPTDAAEERRREDAAKKNGAKKTKIIIKNLPFEASKKDIRTLFGAYGQLRSVRMPKKFDRSTRGFAFAEFVTAREAENAMDALKNTHLLGRRLVLDFASADTVDPEEEIRAMEKKIGQQADKVEAQRLTQSGRKKFIVGTARDEEMDEG